MRAVSLVPSITETLRAWGVDPIACTRYCEQPDLPAVGGVKNPDIEAIIALAPDVVAMDRQENRREDAEALTDAGVPIVVLDVTGLDRLDDEMERLAAAVDISPAPTRTGAFSSDAEAGDGASSAATRRRRAFIPIWRRPWMTIGANTYGSSVLAALGLDNVCADHPADYPTLELTDVEPRHPDIVIVPSEPYEFTDAHLDELIAVLPEARIVRVDGRDLFWWGARTPAALTRLDLLLNAR